MQTIAIDMDETIADTVAKFVACYYRDYGILLTEEQMKGNEIRNIVMPEHRNVFREYLNKPGFFRDLPVMPYAQEVVAALNKKYELYIVSAAMEFPSSLKDKFEWLQEFFPFITWQQVCLCGSKSIIQTDIMIDDRSRNFANFKGRAILYTQNHNLSENGYERVGDWQEVGRLLL